MKLSRIRAATMLLVVILVAILSITRDVYAQGPNVTLRTSITWHIPRSLCATTPDCRLLFRLSERNSLYVFNLDSLVLSVIPNGSANIQTYGLGQFDFYAFFSPLLEYIPVNDEYVLFFDGAGDIYKYDLVKNTFDMLNTSPTSRFFSCGHIWIYPVTRSFMRVGSTFSFIVCDQSYNIGLGVLNGQTLTYTQLEQNTNPNYQGSGWLRLTMGGDGKLYRQLDALPDFSDYQKPNFYRIQYRTLQDNVWTDITLSEESLVKWDVGRYKRGVTRYVNLVGADADSNLYITLSWFIKADRHFRLVKTNSQGQVIWTLTEQDFNGVYPEIIAIAPNGELWLAEKSNDPDYVYQVRKVLVVPAGSSATTTP